jgi:hypothetical protein
MTAKCDEFVPECSRCLKMERKCSGYRDPLELMFHDESAATKKKASFSLENSQANVRSLVHTMCNDSEQCQSFGASLPASVEDFAICHFYHTILNNLQMEDNARYLHTQLPGLYFHSASESAIRLATQAIAYALSTKFGHDATQLSRRRYMHAIRAISKALQDPIEAQSDQTLYSILLLSGYEVSLPSS